MDTLFDKSKLRWDKPFTSAIFGDESSQDENFFVLGALYFWWKTEDYKNQIAKFEAELAAIKRDHGISVIKWQDVPKPSLKLKGYKACIEYLASQTKNVSGVQKGESVGGGLRFKCLVVDTKKYPLKNKAVGSTNKLIGYLKFYTVQLADGHHANAARLSLRHHDRPLLQRRAAWQRVFGEVLSKAGIWSSSSPKIRASTNTNSSIAC
jgi:hypothetical protein